MQYHYIARYSAVVVHRGETETKVVESGPSIDGHYSRKDFVTDQIDLLVRRLIAGRFSEGARKTLTKRFSAAKPGDVLDEDGLPVADYKREVLCDLVAL